MKMIGSKDESEVEMMEFVHLRGKMRRRESGLKKDEEGQEWRDFKCACLD